MSDSLISSLSRLTVSDDTVSSLIRSTPISYSAWTREPPAALLDPAGIVAGDVDPEHYLIPNLPVDQVAALKDPLPLPLKIQPYTDTTAAVAKPNLLLIVASLFALNHVTDPDAAWRTLGQYDVIVPRKVLSSILSGADDVQAYVWRPVEGGPVFIDRKSSYETNPGSIGMQFERAVVRARADHFRYYGVTEVVLDDGRLRVLVSGEVDAVKAASEARVEIKTRPSWARRDLEREFTTWLQAMIGAVRTIVTAGFTAGYGSRTGPVSFASANVAERDTADYFRLGDGHRQRLEHGVQFLDEVIRGVTACGKVYELSCGRGRPRSPVLTPSADLAHCTVTRELIEHLATRKLA